MDREADRPFDTSYTDGTAAFISHSPAVFPDTLPPYEGDTMPLIEKRAEARTASAILAAEATAKEQAEDKAAPPPSMRNLSVSTSTPGGCKAAPSGCFHLKIYLAACAVLRKP